MALMNMFIVNELAKQLINKCRAKNYKLALAESCTGGLISSVITSIPGSSDIFECSFITYSNISKKKILDVSENNLNTDQALNYAFNTVGPALIITTIVLIIGFSIISLSSFNVNASLGQLTALAVFFALFTDFLLLPGVLKKFDKTKKEQS